jgi:uncharacterized membrane protein YgdD (TMEM256/DUF423 family)
VDNEKQHPLQPRIAIAGLAGASAVAAGAFGAHALRGALEPRAVEIFQTAAQYHLVHAAALLALAVLASRGSPKLAAAFWLILAGVAVFSGSLYALALSGIGWLGAVTPIGGVLLIAGWLAAAWAGLDEVSHRP